MIKSIFKISSA